MLPAMVSRNAAVAGGSDAALLRSRAEAYHQNADGNPMTTSRHHTVRDVNNGAATQRAAHTAQTIARAPMRILRTFLERKASAQNRGQPPPDEKKWVASTRGFMLGISTNSSRCPSNRTRSCRRTECQPAPTDGCHGCNDGARPA